MVRFITTLYLLHQLLIEELFVEKSSLPSLAWIASVTFNQFSCLFWICINLQPQNKAMDAISTWYSSDLFISSSSQYNFITSQLHLNHRKCNRNWPWVQNICVKMCGIWATIRVFIAVQLHRYRTTGLFGIRIHSLLQSMRHRLCQMSQFPVELP